MVCARTDLDLNNGLRKLFCPDPFDDRQRESGEQKPEGRYQRGQKWMRTFGDQKEDAGGKICQRGDAELACPRRFPGFVGFHAAIAVLEGENFLFKIHATMLA